MPRLDKTGPMGQGAGTGRGLGHCLNDDKQKISDLKKREKILEEELAAIKKQKACPDQDSTEK
ncbi:DUF5320 domain-containing protein [Patescibacteria group bacterium]|nr:DUF5320 domain-containing protein [Patescibacteria group bacterium]